MRVPFNISFKSIEEKDGKKIVHVNYDEGVKAKTHIQWIPKDTAVHIKEVRIYNQLFKVKTLLHILKVI